MKWESDEGDDVLSFYHSRERFKGLEGGTAEVQFIYVEAHCSPGSVVGKNAVDKIVLYRCDDLCMPTTITKLTGLQLIFNWLILQKDTIVQNTQCNSDRIWHLEDLLLTHFVT